MNPGSVLIIGAGIGGLATAISLGEAGHAVEVVEIQPDMHSSVYGVGIIQPPNAMRALDVIGCAQQCLAEGYAAEVLGRQLDQEGNFLTTLPGPRIPGSDFPPMNGITRPRLHRILTDKASEVGAVVNYSTTVERIEPNADRVEVDLSDGTTRTVDLVVGADGVRSAIRRHVLDEQWEPQYSGKSAIRINLPRLPEIDCIVNQDGTSDDGEMIRAGFVPLAPDLAYMFVNLAWDRSVRPDQAELREITKRKLMHFGGLAATVRDNYIDTDEEIVLRPEEWLIAPAPWNRGRIVLIGDAVHSVTPNTAQGAAQAIEDGIVLADCLSKCDSIEAALTEYSDRRYERCKLIVETGAKIRQWELNPTPGFDPIAMGMRMREALIAPI